MNNLPTSAPVGLVELPQLAAALAAAGIPVVTGDDYRQAATSIRARLNETGAFPVLVSSSKWPGRKAWCERTAQDTRVVVLSDPSVMAAESDAVTTLVLPTTIGAVAAAAGFAVEVGLAAVLIAEDGSLHQPVAQPVAVEPAHQSSAMDNAAPVPAPAPLQTAQPVEMVPAPVIVEPAPAAVQVEELDPWEEQLAARNQMPAAVQSPEVAVEMPAHGSVAPVPVFVEEPSAEQVAAVWGAPAQPAVEEFTPVPVEPRPADEWDMAQVINVDPSPVTTAQPVAPSAPVIEPAPEPVYEAYQPVVEPPSVSGVELAAAADPQLAQGLGVNSPNSYSPAPVVAQPVAPTVPTVTAYTAPTGHSQYPDTGAAQVQTPAEASVEAKVEAAVDAAPTSGRADYAPISQQVSPTVSPAPQVAFPVAAPVSVSEVPDTGHLPDMDTMFAPAPAHRPATAHAASRGVGGEVIVSWAAKGGVGKSTNAVALAQRAASTGLRVILIDSNFGQGDLRTILRLGSTTLPSVYQACASGSLRDGLLDPETITAARAAHLSPIGFAAVLAPPAHLAEDGTVTAAGYLNLVHQARQMADVVVVDTQIIEAQDATGMRCQFVEPLLREGAWGLGITDLSAMGVSNLINRMREFAGAGISRDRQMTVMNRIPTDANYNGAGVAGSLGEHATYLGGVYADTTIPEAVNTGENPADLPALAPMLDTVLRRVTGDSSFDNTTLPATSKPAGDESGAKTKGLLGRFRK